MYALLIGIPFQAQDDERVVPHHRPVCRSSILVAKRRAEDRSNDDRPQELSSDEITELPHHPEEPVPLYGRLMALS